MSTTTVRIATRKSALALWQAEYVKAQLEYFHPGINVVLVPMTTKGDIILDTPLAKVGGKGLFVKGQLCLEVQQAREARALMAQGALKGLSIGYESIQDELDEKSGNRFITEIKLYEYSPVTFPMNEDATIESVKDHKQVFDEALTALLISIRSVKRTSTKLPPYCVEAAQEALNELDTILRNNGSQGNSSSGNLLDHDLKLRPGVGEVDSEMLHSIERLRRNIKHSMKK